MTRIFKLICHVGALLALLAGGPIGFISPAIAGDSGTSSANLGGLAKEYAQNMAAGQVDKWAALDLGCIASKASAQSCWDSTKEAHHRLVYDETEPGIFGALGRGTGFGLIHASHQHADFWKDYPPAIAAAPYVVRQSPGAPAPTFKVQQVHEPIPAGLIIDKEQVPAEVQKISVDLLVTYPDPLTAPLALLPNEPWWASPMVRRYGPVKTLIARFSIVRGLKRLGYPVDQAVVNEALPNAPIIAEPSTPGIVPSSPQWWDRNNGQARFEEGLREAGQATSIQERVRKYLRLLLLDPKEPRLNAMYGMDMYRAFIQEGLKKGKITAEDESLRQRLGELYWNIQAQTWRQEFTEVAVGHSFAAEAFYQSMPALETAIKGGQGNPEMRRILGAIYRWNNDSNSALAIHEDLLKNLGPQDNQRRAQLLAEIAWDRVQWLSWNRRYSHPWMTVSRQEAEQSLQLATTPFDKLLAVEALIILDSLAVPQDQARLDGHVTQARKWHDQLPNVGGMWDHLIGNDLVKALIPEGTQVKGPTPSRSPEVMHRDVHATVQDRNFFKSWNFDKESKGALPTGFVVGSNREGAVGDWKIEVASDAPSPKHILTQSTPCSNDSCFHVLIGEKSTHELPDVVVYLRQVSTGEQGEAGIVLAAKDSRNFNAVMLNPKTKRLSIYGIHDGVPKLLGEGTFKSKPGPWHVLRVVVVNTAHVDHPRLEIYVDGFATFIMASEPIAKQGHVGLVTKSDMVAQFDRFRVMEMITNRPMSKPAAY